MAVRVDEVDLAASAFLTWQVGERRGVSAAQPPAGTEMRSGGAPGTPAKEAPCVDAKVVASAALPRHAASTSVPRSALEPPPPTAPATPSRVRLTGQKYASHVGPRTEAGLTVALDKHLSLLLNYARTAQVPLMPYANDNGILARLRFGF